MKNIEIRNLVKTTGVKMWQIADVLGIADTTLCRKLRKELSQKEKEKIISIIQRLSKEVR